MQIKEFARAKVNLTLSVLGRRPDGYHELSSIVAFGSLADIVILDVGQPPTVTVTGPFAKELGTEYLIANALRVLAERAPDLIVGSIHLDKRLPVAAGIGGGSADAAAVLRAVRRANSDNHRVNAVDWNAIAQSLGADVPICLANRLSHMRGLGEHVVTLPPLATPLHAVLVNPLTPAPSDKTARIFRELAAPAFQGTTAPAEKPASVSDLIARIVQTGNDLEPAACKVMPIVQDMLRELRAVPECRAAAMSGAGPSCFAIYDDATAAASQLRTRQPDWWIEPVTLS